MENKNKEREQSTPDITDKKALEALGFGVSIQDSDYRVIFRCQHSGFRLQSNLSEYSP
jgi:hypothetical protein